MVATGFLSALVVVAIVALTQKKNDFEMFPQEIKSDSLNERPLVGVLAQLPEFICEDEDYSSYIAASYVKFVESSGARVVPLKLTESFAELKEKMDRINGLLLPGGGTPILKSEEPGSESINSDNPLYNEEYTHYMDVSQFLLDLAMEKNDKGIHFPVFGTCLGFQSMILASKKTKNIELCDAPGFASVQTMTNKGESKWFSTLSASAINTLETEKVVYENHPHCYSTDTWRSSQELDDFYLVTSTAVDLQGKEYINSIEGREYPFFGFQYHPEKTTYEWTTEAPIPHEPNAMYWTQYLANQFGTHVKQNFQSYETIEDEEAALIYDTTPLFTKNGYFMQMYCFDQVKKE